MKRFKSAIFILAIFISLGLHALLFLRLPDVKKEEPVPEESVYRVSLKYFIRPEEVKVEQPRRRVKRQERTQQLMEEPPEKEEEPVEQKEPVREEEPFVQGEPAGGGDVSTVDESQHALEEEGEIDSEELEASDERIGTQAIEDEQIRYDEAVAGLRNRIMENKRYPQVARKRNIEGVVRILLSLDEHGEAVELKILESSGSRILDEAALSLIRKVLPYEHGLGRGFSVQIPIKYDLS